MTNGIVASFMSVLTLRRCHFVTPIGSDLVAHWIQHPDPKHRNVH